MQKLKLLPSLKEKKRYLVYEILDNTTHEKIIEEAKKTMGLLESAKAGIRLMKHNSKKGIIRVNNKYTDKLRTIMIINNYTKTIYISGLLDKAIQKIKG